MNIISEDKKVKKAQPPKADEVGVLPDSFHDKEKSPVKEKTKTERAKD